MPAIQILDIDVGPMAAERVRTDLFEECSFPFKVRFKGSSHAIKVVGKDPLLHQKMQDQAIEDARETAAQVARTMQTRGQKLMGLLSKGADRPQLDREMERFQRTTTRFVRNRARESGRNVARLWEELKRSRKQRRKFRTKQGGKIALKTGGLAASVAGAATTPVSGGAGLVVGIAGMVKTVSGMAKDMKDLFVDVEKVARRLATTLDMLFEDYAKQSKNLSGAEDLAKHAFNTLVEWDVAPTISGAEDELKLLGYKLHESSAKSHDVAKGLNSLLNGTEVLKSRSVPSSKLRRRLRSKAGWERQRTRKIEQLESRTGKTLDRVIKIHEKVERCEKLRKTYAHKVSEVKRLHRPKWSGAAELVVEVGDALLFSTEASDLIQPAVGFVTGKAWDKATD